MIASVTSTLVLAQAEGGGEEEGGSFLVTPDIGLMVWTLLVFGLTMFLLAKLAFPPIAAALDKRQRAIEESIDAADRSRQEADKLLADGVQLALLRGDLEERARVDLGDLLH